MFSEEVAAVDEIGFGDEKKNRSLGGSTGAGKIDTKLRRNWAFAGIAGLVGFLCGLGTLFLNEEGLFFTSLFVVTVTAFSLAGVAVLRHVLLGLIRMVVKVLKS